MVSLTASLPLLFTADHRWPLVRTCANITSANRYRTRTRPEVDTDVWWLMLSLWGKSYFVNYPADKKYRTKRSGGNWIKNGLSTIATICDKSYQLSKTIRFPWPNKLHGQRAIRFVVGDVMELDLIVRGWPYVVGGDLFVAVLSYLCICFRLLQYGRTNFITSISLWVIFNPTTAQQQPLPEHNIGDSSTITSIFPIELRLWLLIH